MQDKDLIREGNSQGRHHFAAGAIVIKEGKVLLIRRKLTDSRPGQYEIPSGGVEKDEMLKEAALRELREETGLIGNIISFKNFMDYTARRGEVRQFNFLVSVDDVSKITLTEHDHFLWAEKEKLEEIYMSRECRKSVLEVLTHK